MNRKKVLHFTAFFDLKLGETLINPMFSGESGAACLVRLALIRFKTELNLA